MKHVWRTIHTRARSGIGLALLAVDGCIADPTTPESAASDPAFELRVYEARGSETALDAAPRRPQFVLSSARRFEPGAAARLFRGAPDPALLEDLAGLPLRAAHDARLIDSATRHGPYDLALVPRPTLDPGATYTLAVVATDLGEPVPFAAAVRTAAGAKAGAAWLGTWPAAGAAGVPPNLRAALLALDGEVVGLDEGVWLERPDGLAVSSAATSWSCAEIESRAATCVKFELAGPLATGAHYRLRSGRALRDARGAEVEPLDAPFTTGSAGDARSPSFEPIACLRDEQKLAVGCALLGETSVRVRLRASEPIRAILRSGERQAARLLPEGSGAVDLVGLPRGAPFELELRAIDVAGNSAQAHESLRTTDALATVTLTEVLADPVGPEPGQEFVEIANFGPEPAQLQGYTLVDGDDDRPSVVTQAVALAPAERALLVSDDFDANSPLDPTPLPGTRLIRLGAAITRSGLANAGEPIVLRDASLRRLSAIPKRPAPGRGLCLQRSGLDPRGDGAADFSAGECTPGR